MIVPLEGSINIDSQQFEHMNSLNFSISQAQGIENITAVIVIIAVISGHYYYCYNAFV